MQIPNRKGTSEPTISPTMLRVYGASGVVLPGQEADQGCPRRFKATYVDRTAPKVETVPMQMGTAVHAALEVMENESVPPDDALQRVFPTDLGPEAYEEILTDLNAYLERGASPADRLTVIATEQYLHAYLYDDEDYGPIYVQGYLDWVGIDPNEPHTLHVKDLKYQQRPASRDEVRSSLQMRTYDWLVRQNWSTYMRSVPVPNVVTHIDSVRFSDVDVRYSQQDADMFEAWMVAVARRILRDDKAEPKLNPGCAYCPVRADCPEYLAIPDKAETLLGADVGNVDQRIEWRNRANSLRLLLDKAVKDIDGDLKARTEQQGGIFDTTLYQYTIEPRYADEVNVRILHDAMGDDFYNVVKTSKTAVRSATKDWPPEQVAAVDDAISRVAVGTKFTRKERE